MASSPPAQRSAGSREEQRVLRVIGMGHALDRWAAPRARATVQRTAWRRLMDPQAVAHPARLDPTVAAEAIRASADARIPEPIEHVQGQGGVRDLQQRSVGKHAVA